MSSDRRQQEQREGSDPTGLAWFELYEALKEFSHAEAYPTRYDRANDKFIRDTFSPKRTVYSLMTGRTGATGDFILCYFNPVPRRWEMVQGGFSKKLCVTNGSLAHASSVNVERIRRKADNSAWERSGEIFVAYDLMLNASDTVDTGTIVGVVPYEGLNVIDSIYCAANDWGL